MLQNLQIRSKLAAILLVPLVAVIVLSSIGIGSSVNRAVKASRAQNVSEFAVTLTALVHELQKERSLAAGYVGGGKSMGYTELAAQWANVDRQVVVFAREARRLQLSGYNPRLRQELRNVVSELAKLDAQRQGIDQDPDITVAGTLNLYDTIIQDILDVNGEIAVGSGNERLLRTVSAFVALSRMKDAVDLQRAYMNAVFSAGHFDSGQLQYQQFTRYVEAEDLWGAQFNSFATTPQRNLLASTVAAPSVQQAKNLREVAIRGETRSRLGVTPDEWASVMGDKLNLLRQVELRLSRDVVDAASDIKQSAQRQALIVGIGLLAVLLVTVGMSLAIARSMVRPLRQLRRVAHEVADERLPRVVERLQEAQDLDRVALDQMSPAPVSSRDEIGQVASAFNAVHQVAIRVATEQAALRKSIGDMFLNLARRSQTLLDRQLELIDRLERDEADPDALEHLFKLDHLATRMRRNAEDLIVLSGAEPPRRWSQPVPLVDVVRAAVAEVEDYQRVELLPIDDIGVAGYAVSDVVHALAEVIENAISFSPPGTKVQVAGQPVSNGYVLEIEDRGLGMSDEELVEANERLANPPMIDLALSRMMGLFVVGRLAQRYGIRVQLRHSWYGGVTALVLLPPSITIRSQVQESGTATGIRRPELAPPPRSNGNGGGGQSGDRLPIFEQARSQWFEEPGSAPPPLRRPASQPVDTSSGTGNGNSAAVVGGLRYDADAEDSEAGPQFEPGDADRLEASDRTGPIEPVELVVEPEELEGQVELPAQPEPPPAQPEAPPAQPEPPVSPFHPGGGAEREPMPGFRGQPRFTMPGGPLPRRQRPVPQGSPGSPPEGPAPPPRHAAPEGPGPQERPLPPDRPLPQRAAGEQPVPQGFVPPGGPEPVASGGPGSVAPDWPEPWVPGRPAAASPFSTEPASPFSTDPESQRAPQPPPRTPTRPRPWQQPPTQPRAPRQGEDIAVPLPEPSLQPTSVQTTRAGLPRRVPRANLAPGIVAETQRAADEATSAPPASSFSRSPDEVRSMLSSYRTGLERGRRMAAGNDLNDRGEDARSGYGGPNPMAPRSDDDAAQ
jgi:HAMP domain-containing protein